MKSSPMGADTAPAPVGGAAGCTGEGGAEAGAAALGAALLRGTVDVAAGAAAAGAIEAGRILDAGAGAAGATGAGLAPRRPGRLPSWPSPGPRPGGAPPGGGGWVARRRGLAGRDGPRPWG